MDDVLILEGICRFLCWHLGKLTSRGEDETVSQKGGRSPVAKIARITVRAACMKYLIFLSWVLPSNAA